MDKYVYYKYYIGIYGGNIVVSTRDDINFSPSPPGMMADENGNGEVVFFLFPVGLSDLRPSGNVIRHNMTYTSVSFSYYYYYYIFLVTIPMV